MFVTEGDLNLLVRTVWQRAAATSGFSDTDFASTRELEEFVRKQAATLHQQGTTFLKAYREWWGFCSALESAGTDASSTGLTDKLEGLISERDKTRQQFVDALKKEQR